MKLRIIAVAVGLSIVGCAARANQITFSGVITSAVGSGIFSPPPISVGDTFFGSVTFDASNAVLGAEVAFPRSGLSTGFSGGFEGPATLTPISNGYFFDSGEIISGLDASDSFFGFEFHDNVNSFSANADFFTNPSVNFELYQGRISHFSVPEGGGTIGLLALSVAGILGIRILSHHLNCRNVVGFRRKRARV